MLQPSKQLRQYFQYPSTELERLICNVEDLESHAAELQAELDELDELDRTIHICEGTNDAH